jgi:4-amino-4-deoxy-L-arabinose transferase-like glycosyltransferase
MLRLGGIGRPQLPGTGVLAVTLAVLVTLARVKVDRWSDWRRALDTHGFAIGLAFVVLLALAVRLPGLSSELGHTPIDVDENRLGANVQHFFVTGELGHETVEHYPGAVFWLFAAGSFLGYLKELARGSLLSPDQLPVDLFVRSARLCNVFAGAAIAAFSGLVGRRLFGDRAGLLAAVIVGIVPLSVDTTTLERNDPGMVLAVVAAVLLALISLEDPRRLWVIGSGALAGIAAGIKYSSVFALVPAALAAGGRGPLQDRLARVSLAILGFVVAVGVTNHFVWADFPTFLRQLADQVAITGRGHWAATDNPAAFYVEILDRFGTGWPLLLLAASFAVYGLCSGTLRHVVFLSFPLLYIWFMTHRPAQFPRWVFPMLPFVAVAGAGALAAICRLPLLRPISASARRATVVRFAPAIIIVAALWVPVTAGVVSFSRRVTSPTHTLVERWFEQHAAPQSVVILETGWLDLQRSDVIVRRVPELKALLDGGPSQLAGAQWVVVPEPNFGHPTLGRLGLVQRFHSSQAFGGNVGYDYEVYAVPQMPASPGAH